MKVGIAGNYGHSNLGDEALLLGAIELARTDAGIAIEDIVVLTDNSEDTASRLAGMGCETRQLKRQFGGKVIRLPLVIKDIFNALRGLDWLIFGGGGLLNDSNRTAIPLFVLIRILAWFRGVRVAWWSVGIGPLDAQPHRALGSWLLRTSSFVTIRDEDSARLAADMSSRSFKLTPDLAHAVAIPVRADNSDVRPLVAISVIPYGKQGIWFKYDDAGYSRYCHEMVKIVDGILEESADIRVCLFPVSLQQDAVAIKDIMELGNFGHNGRVQASDSSSVETLLSDLGCATVVIATRLHSVVLATLAGVPCVTIAYQPKVRSYAMELPTGLPCFNIENFSAEDVISACSSLVRAGGTHRSLLLSENDARRSRLREAVLLWRQRT